MIHQVFRNTLWCTGSDSRSIDQVGQYGGSERCQRLYELYLLPRERRHPGVARIDCVEELQNTQDQSAAVHHGHVHAGDRLVMRCAVRLQGSGRVKSGVLPDRINQYGLPVDGAKSHNFRHVTVLRVLQWKYQFGQAARMGVGGQLQGGLLRHTEKPRGITVQQTLTGDKDALQQFGVILLAGQIDACGHNSFELRAVLLQRQCARLHHALQIAGVIFEL